MADGPAQPTRIGPCRVVRRLGTGGMGTVYEAEVAGPLDDVEPGTQVAVKVLHAHLAEQEGFARRFVREAELGLGLVHPNLVRTLGHGRDGALWYAILELVTGQTLDDLREELGRVPESLCLHVARQVCRALAVLHEAGVVHRDLKPENVLITPEHEVRLMDLGIAKSLDDELHLTRSGAFVGSPLYASPEQFQGHAEPRSDLFSLGILLYELATGENPHRAQGFQNVMRRVLHDEPRRLGELDGQLSAFFEELVHTLLVKDPRGRFGSAAELERVIREREDGTWWRARATAMRRATRRPLRRIRIPRETAVHGRDAELARLEAAFSAAADGRGRVVLLSGEAGVGKSRLVDELVGRLERAGHEFDFAFGAHPPGGAGGAVTGLAAALREAVGGSGVERHLRDSPRLVPYVDALLRGDLPPPDAHRPDLGALAGCFVRIVRGLASERPIVLLVEDLHFAEEAGRALFAALAQALADSPVLLVGTLRRSTDEAWRAQLSRLAHCDTLELARLGAKDVVRLLEEALGASDLGEELGYQVLVKSDGNPFFVFELIRGLREGNFLERRADGTWATTRDVRELRLPSSVLDLIEARVSGLTEEERNLLDVAACLGFEFDPVLVGRACGLRRIPALRAFARIEREHRLVHSAGRDYVFDHHQVQEVLYDGLNVQLREAYHACLADELVEDGVQDTPRGAAAVAGHRLRAGQAELVVPLLDDALRHLEVAHEHEEAVRLVDAVLAQPGLVEGDARAGLLLRVGSGHGALDRLARRDRQLAFVTEAAALVEASEDANLRLLVARARSQVHWRRSEAEEAERAAREAIDLARELGDRRLEGASWGDLGNALTAAGRYDEAGEAHRTHAELMRGAGSRRGEAVALGNLGMVARMQGRLSDAARHHERQLAIAEELGDRYVEANACANLGIVRRALNDFDGARELYVRHQELCREQGDRDGEVRAVGNLGNLLWSLGRLEEGRSRRARHLELCREIGYRRGEAIAHYNLAISDHESGDAAAALAGFRACEHVCGEIGFGHLGWAAALGVGSVLADQTDRVRDAVEQLERCLEGTRRAGLVSLATQSACLLASVDPTPERIESAHAALTETEARLSPQERLYCEKLLWDATGDLDHLERAKQLLDESLAALPELDRDRVRTRMRLPRELLADWRRQHPATEHDAATLVDPTTDDPATTEAETRVDPTQTERP